MAIKKLIFRPTKMYSGTTLPSGVVLPTTTNQIRPDTTDFSDLHLLIDDVTPDEYSTWFGCTTVGQAMWGTEGLDKLKYSRIKSITGYVRATYGNESTEAGTTGSMTPQFVLASGTKTTTSTDSDGNTTTTFLTYQTNNAAVTETYTTGTFITSSIPGVVDDTLKSFLEDPVPMIAVIVNSGKSLYPMTQAYIEIEYDVPDVLFKTATGWQNIEGPVYQKQNGTWTEVNPSMLAVSGSRPIITSLTGLTPPNRMEDLLYIESTGKQYINTGYVPNSNTRVELVAQFSETPTANEAMFGVRYGDAQQMFAYYRPSENKFFYRFGTDSSFNLVEGNPTQRNHFIADKNTLTVNEFDSVTTPSTELSTTYPLYLFAVNHVDNGSPTMYSKLKIYTCKIYDNDTLVRDFIPRKQGNIPGLYDLVEKKFYPCEGAIAGQVDGKKLSYIRSDGHQYINTGIIGKSNLKIECEFEPTAILPGAMCLIGSMNSSTCLYAVTILEDGTAEYNYNGNHYTNNEKCTSGKRYVTTANMLVDNQSLVMNDIIVGSSTDANEFTTNIPLYIFASNNNGTSIHSMPAKLYYCKIYDGNTLVRDFIPFQLSNSEAGLLDILTQTFYPNQGSGEFITPNTLITFTVDNISFVTEQEMTWREWVKTSYNTGEFSISDTENAVVYIKQENLPDDENTPEEPEITYDPVFANNEWSAIMEACANNRVPSTWAVNDSKPMDIGGTNYNIDIIDKNHDDFADGSGKAPLTLQMHECFTATAPMNTLSTNAGGWADSGMRSSLESFLKLMPAEVQAGIKQVNKLTSAGNGSETINTTADKIFLLSEVEIFGSSQLSVPGEGTQYAYYKNGNSKIKNVNGVASEWWLRSPILGSLAPTVQNSHFCFVSGTGTSSAINANNTYGASFAFCFGYSPSGSTVGAKNIGSTVCLNENGSPVEYLVVHQGNPDPTIYDSSCNGTWLLRKDIYENKPWHSTDLNDYANSSTHDYLNNTFLNMFDSQVQSLIGKVKIPYRAGSGASKTISTGANGLSTSVFLLSTAETSIAHSDLPTNEGAELAYFAGSDDMGAAPLRVANYAGAAGPWWLRTPFCNSSYASVGAVGVLADGSISVGYCSSSHGIRPAIILPANAIINDNGLITGEKK